jgi:hypothetical protein
LDVGQIPTEVIQEQTRPVSLDIVDHHQIDHVTTTV